MTKRQRSTLDRLRELTAEYQQYIPYLQNKTIIEVADYICTILYGVLVDCSENEYLEYNLEQTEDAIKKFEEILEHERKIN